MSRGIHWQIQFKTIQEDLLTISIYHKNYSGAIVQLTGGSTPMVTEELKSDNILEPIRHRLVTLTSAVAAQLRAGYQSNSVGNSIITGEQIVTVINNYGRRTGRGEILK